MDPSVLESGLEERGSVRSPISLALQLGMHRRVPAVLITLVW
jgi:hypothetical protein